MASIAPLNEFKSVPFKVTTSSQIIYTTPIAISTIVLKIQVANVSDVPDNVAWITVSHLRGSTSTKIIYKGPILANDFSIVSDGKLVLQEGDSIQVNGSGNNILELIMSCLETSA